MRKSKPIELEQPTCDLVQRYVRQFENSERYSVGDQAIIKLFPNKRLRQQAAADGLGSQ